MLDTLEALELDFNHFFRRLSNLSLSELETEEQRVAAASVFFHAEGFGAIGYTEESARARIAKWLDSWRARVIEDWGSDGDSERQAAMKAVNPNVRSPPKTTAYRLFHFDSTKTSTNLSCLNYSLFLEAGFWTKSLRRLRRKVTGTSWDE
jgi:uncharacterized protein YdiU (UPF0061 family)